MEKIDIVNSDLEVVRQGYRGERLGTGEYLKFVHVWIVSGDEILIQKRSSTRKWAPNKWATHTGVVASMEKEESCAIREVYEELGIKLSDKELFLGFKTQPINNFSGIGFIYFATINHKQVKIDNDEVCDYDFVSIDELKLLVESKQFIKYFEKHRKGYYFDKVYEILENVIGGSDE